MPRRVRPTFPKAWHVPEDPKLWVTWAHASSKLRIEQVYWVSTSSSGGRPHSAPVWGIWKKDTFYFETSPGSVKGRNLRANPLAVVHIQDGLDTVIVEGRAEQAADPGDLRALALDYRRKYDYSPDWSDEASQVVFKVTPVVVHAWRAPRMHRSMVNFLF